jgi:hypothetical protein
MKKGLSVFLAVLMTAVCCGAVLAAPAKGFDAKAYGLKGNYSAIQELSGNFQEGKPLTVRLIGKHEKNAPYYDGFWLELIPEEGDKTIVALKEGVQGYEPYMEARHFVHPRHAEIFLSLQSGGSGGLGNYYVIGVTEDGKLRHLFDSDSDQPPTVIGSFMDKYRAKISVEGLGVRSLVNLDSRKNAYDQEGVFASRNGKLKKPVQIWGGGYSDLRAIDADNDGVDELRGVLQLSGTSHADRIADVYYTLAYRGGKWEILNARIEPADDLTLARTAK